MEKLHTTFRKDAHDYTRENVPWMMDEHKSVYGKLIHYLSGGGMSAFGRSVEQEKVRARHRRFLIIGGVVSAIWLIFLCI